MSCAIAIFVKTPGLSVVKSRLWPGIGRAAAERLHLASAAAVRSVVSSAAEQSSIEGYWALAESAELSAMQWTGLLHVEQGQGPLGERMAAVYGQLRKRHHGVLLIGADAPQIKPGVLIDAANWLLADAPRLVIGRAEDGGFWLFGGNQDLATRRWSIARYSTPSTADEFVGAMVDCGEWLELETLRDLDTPADIEPIRAELQSLDHASTEQRDVGTMLSSLLAVTESFDE